MKWFFLAVMALTLLIGCDPFREGRRLVEEGKYEEAARFYLAKTRKNPKDFLALNELGFLYVRMEMLSRAEEAYVKAIKVKPDFFPAHLNLGTMYLKNGNIDGAYHYLQKALELNPESETAHANFAWTLTAAWRCDEAETHFRRAVELSGGKNKYQDLAEAIAQRRIEKEKIIKLREKMQAEINATLAAQGGSTAEPSPASGPPEVTPLVEPSQGSTLDVSDPPRRGRGGREERVGGQGGRGGRGRQSREQTREEPN